MGRPACTFIELSPRKNRFSPNMEAKQPSCAYWRRKRKTRNHILAKNAIQEELKMNKLSMSIIAAMTLVYAPIAKATLTEGLVGYWSFDDWANPGCDDSGNGHDGTVHGATWMAGKFGGALSFDGADNYVSVPDEPALDILEDITISAWVDLTRGGSYQAIVTKCVGSGARNNPFDFRTTWHAKPDLAFIRADAIAHERVYGTAALAMG